MRTVGATVRTDYQGRTTKVAFPDKKLDTDTLEHVATLEHLSELNLAGTPVTDNALQQLGKLKKLKHLNLSNTAIGDSGLKDLTGIALLETLVLSRSKITNAGLAVAARMAGIRELYLANTAITDKGLKHIESIKQLSALGLSSTGVTDEGLASLKKLKSLNSESPKTTVELAGWPSGKSAWDRHVKIRLKIRKEIGPLIPSGVEDTPRGTGLVQLFQRIAHSLFMNPSHNKDMLKLSDVM